MYSTTKNKKYSTPINYGSDKTKLRNDLQEHTLKSLYGYIDCDSSIDEENTDMHHDYSKILNKTYNYKQKLYSDTKRLSEAIEKQDQCFTSDSKEFTACINVLDKEKGKQYNINRDIYNLGLLQEIKPREAVLNNSKKTIPKKWKNKDHTKELRMKLL